MAKTSSIAWTTSTFNPWIGCTKIGPGCDHCYAESQDSRKRWGKATHWGPGVPRHRTSVAYWKQPLGWNAIQRGKQMSDPLTPPHRVFCASLADVFDNDVPMQWRIDLMDLIRATPYLSWLLVTKRIGNAKEMMRQCGGFGRIPSNVRLMITVVNQEEADRDIPKLLSLRCKNGISYEPALGAVDWSRWVGLQCDRGSVPGPCGIGGVTCQKCNGTSYIGCRGVEWVIIGGESAQGGHMARAFNIEWARSTISQCKYAEVPVFMKQSGSNPIDQNGGWQQHDRAGADPAEWPHDLNVREFP